jgi:hypothetical protein
MLYLCCSQPSERSLADLQRDARGNNVTIHESLVTRNCRVILRIPSARSATARLFEVSRDKRQQKGRKSLRWRRHSGVLCDVMIVVSLALDTSLSSPKRTHVLSLSKTHPYPATCVPTTPAFRQESEDYKLLCANRWRVRPPHREQHCNAQSCGSDVICSKCALLRKGWRWW